MHKITPCLWFDNQAEEAMLHMVKIEIPTLQQVYDAAS